VRRPAAPLLLALLLGCSTEPPAGGDDRVAWGTSELPRAGCVGDGDGVIEEGELALAESFDLRARFLVNRPGVEQTVTDRWDLPSDPEGLLLDLGPQRLDAQWYAARFPEAQFAGLLDASEGTWGAWRLAEDGLELLGLASETPDEVALAYSEPVRSVPLPLRVGDTWQHEVDAEGVVDGEPVPRDLGADGVISLLHRWSFSAEERGTLPLPLGDIDTLRVRATVSTELRNSAAGLIASDVQRVDLYVAECLGVVARVRSRIDEPSADFTAAVEVLRAGLDPELLP
jgi:hypothetical protein